MGVTINNVPDIWEGNANGIHYNGGFVGIGTSTPGMPLEVFSDNGAYGITGRVFNNASSGFNLRIMKARGTATTPLRARSGDILTGYNAFPYYAANDVDMAAVTATAASAQFQFRSTEAATSTAKGTGFRLNLCPVGSVTTGAQLDIYHDGTDWHINIPNMPTGAGAPPAGLVAGDLWMDTAAGNVVKRV